MDTQIYIIDEDSYSAALVKNFLVAKQVDFAQVIDSKSFSALKVDLAAVFVLWIGEVEKADFDRFFLKDADVFKRPVRFGAVLDRLEGLRRKADRGEGENIIQIAGYELDRVLNILRRGGQDISLKDKERAILLVLKGRGGQAVDRDTLLSEVWGHRSDLETHTVETHIYRLRQKIESDPATPQILITDGEGYRLVDS